MVTLLNALGRLVLLLLVSVCLLFQCKATNSSKRALLGLAVLLLLGLDALTHTPRQNATIPNEGYGPIDLGLSSKPATGNSRAMVSPQMEAFLANAATPNPLDCYIGARHSLYMDCNLLDDIPVVGGFYPMNLREEAQVRSLFSEATNFPSGLGDFLGVAETSSPDQLWQWSARDSFLPWATAGQKPFFADERSTLLGLSSADFNPRRMFYLPLSAQGHVAVTNASTAEVRSLRFSAQTTTLEVSANAPSWVVIAQCFYPAWRAYLDGRPIELWRANHAFQAVVVPAGQHRVELRYEDHAFRAGAVISALTLAGIIAVGRLYSGRTPA
jgi:hypothetical protein